MKVSTIIEDRSTTTQFTSIIGKKFYMKLVIHKC